MPYKTKLYKAIEKSDLSGNSRSELPLKGKNQCNPSDKWPYPLLFHHLWQSLSCT